MSGEGLSQRGAEFQLQPVPASKRKRSTANNEKPRIWSTAVQQPTRHIVPSNKPVRMRRSQSLPNMKAKYSLDLSSNAQHSIAIPSRMAQAWNPARGWKIASTQQSQPNHALMAGGLSSSGSSNIAGPSGSPEQVHYASATPVTLASPAVPHQSPTVFTPSVFPPINSQTLKELDLHEILKNPQLRHDLVFDADLQFRPNFDGERGKRKRDVCNKYWRAVQREIQSRCACTSFYGGLELPCVCASSRRRGSGLGMQPIADPRFFARIPNLIAELRCICLSILPTSSGRSFTNDPIASAPAMSNGNSFANRQRDALLLHRKGLRNEPQTAQPQKPSNKSTATPSTPSSAFINSSLFASPITHASDEQAIIVQCLDPGLIMQQLYYGGLDITGLVTTVGSILKQHCAPMRDSLIDNMIETVTNQGDVTRSLRQCFEILELMKLDVANHQLSTSRIYLVETAAEFESRWFRDQVCRGKLSVQRTVKWFTDAMSKYAEELDASISKTERISKAFDGGVLDLIFDPPSASAPKATFGNFSAPSRLSSLHPMGAQAVASMTYPESFQFDAFRLLTFHGEVTDITVVSMLLLLYRQLACSPQNLASTKLPFDDESCKPSASALSALAYAQQGSIKGEIWTLLREAEVERSAQDRTTASTNTTIVPPTPGGVASRVLDSRLTSWRKVVGDIVLQIAARAIQVQVDARKQQMQKQGKILDADAEVSIEELAPSQATIDLLTRWLETNIHSSSPMFKLCRTRVRNLLAKLTVTPPAGTAIPSPLESPHTPSRLSRKRSAIEHGLPSAKRVRLCPPPISPREPIASVIPDAGDLEPFVAEMELLAERIKKVKSFHLQVYRSHYEHMAASHHQRKAQTQRQHSQLASTTKQHPVVFVDSSVMSSEQEQAVQQAPQEQEQQKA
ncbi:hypothetical protein L7F22_052694 [Adiantum nelumboides]|nr:hypothetical protein [Adiantum nelumboides]